ncbi:MAG: gliding motility-associated C-terminal domain-containing protein [Brumimicrobium sp.]
MSDKDYIKELFQKELGNYEAKVDPSLWNGIQSGLGGASAAGAGGMSVLLKTIIGVVVGSVAIVGSVLVFSDNEKEPKKEDKVVQNVINEDPSDQTQPELDEKEEPKSNSNKHVISSKDTGSEKSETKDNVVRDKDVKINTEKIEIDSSITSEEPKQQKEEDKQTEKTPAVKEEVEQLKEEETEKPQPLNADAIIEDQKNQYVKFNVLSDNASAVSWSFGDGDFSDKINPEHFYDKAGKYIVTVTVYGEEESIEKQLEVIVNVEGKITKTPNTFTPNNDGSNDELFIEHEGLVEFQLNVFNEQQELIYSTTDPDFKWMGIDNKGKSVPEGSYVYIIMAKDAAGNVINKYQRLSIRRSIN